VKDGIPLRGSIYPGAWFCGGNPNTGVFLAGQIKRDGYIEGVSWYHNGGVSMYHALYMPSDGPPLVVYEVEPNNSSGTATSLGQKWSGTGTISSATDADYFVKSLAAGTYQFRMTSGANSVVHLGISFSNGQPNSSCTDFRVPCTFTVSSPSNAYFAFTGDATHSGQYQFSLVRTAKR